MIEATLNGQTSQFEDGVTILNACRATGLDIPTLCNDPRRHRLSETAPS